MAAELLGGNAIGAVFGGLVKVIENVTKKALVFKTKLKQIQETLESNSPILNEIKQLDERLDRRNEQIEKIMEVIRNGETLVLECSKIRWYHFWRRPKYTDKLIELERSINQFFQTVMPAQIARGNREILVEVAMGELKMKLFKDGVSIVVLSAPPGCGKTTLARLLCHDKEVEEKFKDNIFYVTVSKNTNMEGIVRALFHHKGQKPPSDFRSDEDVVYRLEQFLNSMGPSPILLVLDDVWPESESFLEKFMFQIKDYKILVTSRSVFRRFGSTYELKPLKYEDSLTLFRSSAFLPHQSQDIPDNNVVSKIVKGCKGFPLALKVVGRSLRGEPEEIWKTRAMELSKVGSIFEYSDLRNSLQKSLDALDNKVILKECFIDLCSFPEDQRIPVNALVDMNVASGCYNQQFAMQHDLLRELAICQSDSESIERRKRLILEISANNVPAWWMEQKQPTISCRLLSISTDEKFSSSWCFIQAPEVEVLVLNVRSKNHTLPEFIKKMEKLKVLMVKNYGFFPTELHNFLLLGSATNLKRIRLEHVSIPPFAFTSVKLEILQKLTLYMCNISQAFSTSTILLSEALPNIMEINIEYSNDLIQLPVGICLLTKLKKLSIINCHKLVALPKEIGKLVNLEDLRLGSCIELLELPNTIGGLCNLSVLDISECLEIERLPEEIGELQNLRQLLMMGCSSNCELPQSIVNLEHLEEVVCDEEAAILWKPIMFVCENLRVKVQKEEVNLNWLYNHRL
ncbi:hypothetical protein POTOM_026953 [Populus tomentosa]|uniref:RPW8 domain-containing protein n=1 Tax=Populus tomentosa TaxID=118781 RepID=A0A8X7ZFG0_POPTO|nr:hypothetical protein POTOM_026953 [Populus tomentosa]